MLLLSSLIRVLDQKGRTVHLLKQRSKPVPQQTKRRKIDLLGTFEQYKHAVEERKQGEA